MAALRWPEKQSARGVETALNACIGVPCTAQTPSSPGFGACLAPLIAISLEQTSVTELQPETDADAKSCLEACSP